MGSSIVSDWTSSQASYNIEVRLSGEVETRRIANPLCTDAISVWASELCYRANVLPCRGDGMVDIEVLNTSGSDAMRVRVPPPVL